MSYDQGIAMKSTAIAYLLWIPPLGLLGIHRFYLGRPWTGLLWLLTAGLGGIGWLIDAVMLPGMVRHANLEERVYRTENLIRGAAPAPRSPAPAMVASSAGPDPTPTIYCTYCGQAMRVRLDHRGRQVRCPGCRRTVGVPVTV